MLKWFRNNIKGDYILWFVVALLALWGILAIYSSTCSLAYKQQHGNTEYYLIKHGGILAMGLFVMWLTHLIDFQYFTRPAKYLIYLAIGLLLYTLIFGTGLNSARRWLMIPVVHLTFQPSDFAKVALVMYIAQFLSKRQGKGHIDNFRKTFLPVLIVIVVVCGLIGIADLSTAAVLFSTSLLLLFIGRIPAKYLLALFGSGVVVLSIVVITLMSTDINVGRVSTWKARIENYVNFMKGDETAESYQNQQANIAIANGGFLGKGPGKSEQRNFLPLAFSDFIYAIIIEEYGLLGGLFVMGLYLTLLWRAVRIVIHSPKAFGALLAIGLSFTLVIQAFMNMGVAVHLLPNTGLPLPFISMGGTSLLFTSLAMGIILSVSRYTQQENTADEEA